MCFGAFFSLCEFILFNCKPLKFKKCSETFISIIGSPILHRDFRSRGINDWLQCHYGCCCQRRNTDQDTVPWALCQGGCNFSHRDPSADRQEEKGKQDQSHLRMRCWQERCSLATAPVPPPLEDLVEPPRRKEWGEATKTGRGGIGGERGGSVIQLPPQREEMKEVAGSHDCHHLQYLLLEEKSQHSDIVMSLS